MQRHSFHQDRYSGTLACFFPVDGAVDAVCCYHVNAENTRSGSIVTKATLLPLHTLIIRSKESAWSSFSKRSPCIFLWLFLSLLWHLLLRPSRSGRLLRSTWLGIVPWPFMACRKVFRGAYLVITFFDVTDNKSNKVGSGNSNIPSKHRDHQYGDQW
jgi:hypothetical protein